MHTPVSNTSLQSFSYIGSKDFKDVHWPGKTWSFISLSAVAQSCWRLTVLHVREFFNIANCPPPVKGARTGNNLRYTALEHAAALKSNSLLIMRHWGGTCNGDMCCDSVCAPCSRYKLAPNAALFYGLKSCYTFQGRVAAKWSPVCEHLKKTQRKRGRRSDKT